MTRKMLRTVILLATVSLTGIMATQLFWLMRAFDLGEKQFTHNVTQALNNVVESLCNFSSTDYPGTSPVEQLASNYFVVRTNTMIDPKVLEYFLKAEIEKRQVSTAFEYGIYDCSNEKMVFSNTINLDKGIASTFPERKFPELNKESYYFGVYFPDRPAFIAGQMGIWVFSTLVLLIVVIYFAYTLYVIFRQRKLSEIQKDFINNMTHEFRTPLATIAISAEVLKGAEMSQQPERLHNYAHIIESEARKLKNQVERVLEMVSIENEEIQLRKERVNMHEVIEAAITSIRPLLIEKSGQIQSNLSATGSTIVGDKLHLANIVFNLLDNAIKYGEKAPAIEVYTTSSDKFLEVHIKDNGLGIAPDEQARVFERFYRVHTGNVHNAKGFGIGLNYVKIIAEAHGGSIKLQSKPGDGSIFTLKFPLCKPQ